MARSQNGWVASPDTGVVNLTKLEVRGVGFLPGVRGGDVHTVLGYVAEQLNARVERPINPGCWGFYYRGNRNGVGLSNHASATAIDYNAPAHPNGVPTSRTWSPGEIREIHQILDEVDHVVRWGGDYQRTPDAMHFEINDDRAAVARVATKIRGGITKTVVKPGGVNLDRVRDQFLLAVNGQPTSPLPGVARIQAALNQKYGAMLATDGWVGTRTLDAYGDHEEKVGVVGRPRVPDATTLPLLLAGTPYSLTDDPEPAPPPPPPAPAPIQRPPAPRVPAGGAWWVARQCNVQGTDPQHVVISHIVKVARGADVVRWNELPEPARDYIKAGLTGKASVVRGQLGISWDNQVFRYVTHDYERTHKGFTGATPERGILSVLLEHRTTGKQHWEPATHSVHRIDAGGRARVVDLITGQSRRARIHFAKLAQSVLTHELGGKVGDKTVPAAPVTGSGDLNVDYIAEKNRAPEKRTPWFPYTVLGAVATPVMPRRAGVFVGTHGGRAIDWGWRAGPINVTRCTTLPRGSSDHNPVEYITVQP